MLAFAERSLIRRDGALPGLATLLDPDAFGALLAACCPRAAIELVTPNYLRYKPGTNCLAGYRVGVAGQLIDVYAKCYRRDSAIPGPAPQMVANENPLHLSYRWLPASMIALSVFPTDQKLPGLRRLARAASTAQWLSESLPSQPELWPGRLERLVYKPERRFVARLVVDEQPRAVLRFQTDSGYATASQAATAFAANRTPRLARCLDRSRRNGLLAVEWLPGDLLWPWLSDSGLALATIGQVGMALAEFHAQSAAKLRTVARDDEVSSLLAVADGLTALVPERTSTINQLAHDLAERWRARPSVGQPIHGDFYAKQILLHEGQVAILDLDEAALGDPLVDLGTFIAHLERDELRGSLTASRREQLTTAFIDGYAAARGRPDPAALSLATAVSLLRLAPHPFRHREPDWPGRTGALLDRVARLATVPTRGQPGSAPAPVAVQLGAPR